jgi:hypothetical protein
MQVGNFALGLIGLFSSKRESDRQVAMYEYQAQLNRQIGAFNAEVAMQNGVESVNSIALQTKRNLGRQMVSFANRGVSMEGSPMFVLGDTLTMGSKQAQEAYFNAEVQKTNYIYGAQTAGAQATSAAENARYQSLSKTIGIFQQFMDGAKLMNSANANSSDAAVKKSIFNNATWTIA